MKRGFSITLYIFLFIVRQTAAERFVDSLKIALKSTSDPVQRCVILSKLSDSAPEGEWQRFTEMLGKESEKYIGDDRYSKDTGLMSARAIYFNNAAILFSSKTDYVNGIQFLDSAFLYLKMINDSIGLSTNQNNIGAIYDRLGDANNALVHYKKALRWLENQPSTNYSAGLYNNLGKLTVALGDTAKGLFFYKCAKDVVSELNLKDYYSVAVFKNLGFIFLSSGEIDSAYQYLNAGITIAREIDDTAGLAFCKAGLASVYLRTNKLDSAKSQADNAFNLLYGSSHFYELKEVARIRYEVYTSLKDEKTAFESFKVFVSARDSVSSQENQKSMFAYQVESELREKERLRQEKIKHEAERMRIRYIVIITLTILLIAALTIRWNSIRLRQRTIMLKAAVDDATAQLRIQREWEVRQLQDENRKNIVRTQEDERLRIGRDLHDDLGARLSTLKLMLQSVFRKEGGAQEPAKESYISLLDSAISDMRSIITNLSPKALQENGYLKAVEELVASVSKTEAVKFELSMHGMDRRFDTEFENSIFRITQELINNSLKYGKASLISLNTVFRNGKVVIMFEDNGTGFDADKATKGYGLKNIRSRAELYGGEFYTDTAPGKGFRCEVILQPPT
jgi:signal transduction histidine kinase